VAWAIALGLVILEWAIDRYQNNALFNVSNLYPGVDFSVKFDMLESPLLT
jgi:hypothetical protein